MTRKTRRLQVRGRSALKLPLTTELVALPASASAAPYEPTIPITGFGDHAALAQIEASDAFGAPELLADAQTATLPQPTGAAITPTSAVAAWLSPQGGRVTRMSGR